MTVLLGLTAIEPTVLERLREFVRSALEILVIAFAIARQHHPHDMMKVIRPATIETETALSHRLQQSRLVSFVFGDDETAFGVHALRDLREDVARRGIRDRMGRIE